MKKIASILAFATSVFVVALPSSAQVIPIISGSITINGVRNGNGGFDIAIPSSNLLTPAGTVSLTTIANYTYIGNNGGNNFSLTSTSFNTSVNPFLFPDTSSTLTGDANGSLAGTPFILKPIVVITTGSVSGFYISNIGGLNNFNFGFTNKVTGGSLTLSVPAPVIPAPVIPAPVTCDGCLIVRPEDLLIANSTFLSPDSQEPEYRQEYRNNFSTSSFEGGRILGLEDK